MITIAIVVLASYVGVSLLFVLGLAVAASRPIPPASNVIELPADMRAEGESSLERAA
jgi:hypothetical protein